MAIDERSSPFSSTTVIIRAGARQGRRDLTARRVVSYHGFHGRRD
jgi:hypothetical protein